MMVRLTVPLLFAQMQVPDDPPHRRERETCWQYILGMRPLPEVPPNRRSVNSPDLNIFHK